MSRAALPFLFLFVVTLARGEVAAVLYDNFIHWGGQLVIHGIELETGKEVWRIERKREFNFVGHLAEGALAGCDDGTLTLLH